MMHFNNSNNPQPWKDFPGVQQQRYFIKV